MVILLLGMQKLSYSQFSNSIGTTWEYVNYDHAISSNFAFPAFTDSIVNDTAINNVIYQEIHRWGTQSDTFFLRVSGDTLLVLDSVAGNFNFESIVFDFSINDGDSIYFPLRSVHVPSYGYASASQGGGAYLDSIGQVEGNTKYVPAPFSGESIVWLENVGQLSYALLCLADWCPAPDYRLKRCISESDTLYEDDEIILASTNEADQINDQVKLFPNPNEGDFTIQTDKRIRSVKIYNSLGQLIDDKRILAELSSMEIHMTGMSGIYFVIVEIDGGVVGKKMMVGD